MNCALTEMTNASFMKHKSVQMLGSKVCLIALLVKVQHNMRRWIVSETPKVIGFILYERGNISATNNTAKLCFSISSCKSTTLC
jgi:hypothetical protein